MSASEPPPALAAELDLSPAQVARRVEHLSAYANLALAEAESGVEGIGGPGLLPPIGLSDQRRDALRMDAASALREAGQLALLVEPGRSAELLSRSGEFYLRAAVPYGSYLLAVSGPVPRTWQEAFGDHLDLALRSVRPGSRIPPRRGRDHPTTESPTATLAATLPQQQVYLLLAGIADPQLAERNRTELAELMRTSPHRRSNQPVGALGAPVMRLWAAAEELMALGVGRSDADMPRVMGMLDWLAARHADAMDLARVNRYLWESVSAPVEVVDLDLVGLGAIAMRLIGVDQVLAVVGRRFDSAGVPPMEFDHLTLARTLV